MALTTSAYRDERLLVLFRHFLVDLFESDFFSVRERLLPVLAGVLSLLASFGLVLPLLFNHKYHVLNALPSPELFQEAELADKLMFVCISMAACGLVTAVQWQALFPSAGDFAILGPLPIERWHLFVSKFVALFVFVTLAIVAVNALPSFTMPGVMNGRWQLPSGSLMHPIAFFLAGCSAGYFSFFSLMLLQALLMNLLPSSWFARISGLVQAFVVLLLWTILPLLLWIPDLHAFTRAQPLIAWLLPPAWFVAWQQEMLGNADPFLTALASRARLALVASASLAILFYAVNYGRQLTSSQSGRAPFSAGFIPRLLSLLLHRTVKPPGERAVVSFSLKSILRSRVHKLLLSAILGIGLSVCVDSFSSLWIAQLVTHRVARPAAWESAVLSTPLIVTFFLLCGLRILFLLPVQKGSNWVFRLSHTSYDDYVTNGTERSWLLVTLIPVIPGTLLAYNVYFGFQQALSRSLFVVLMSLLLSEALLWNWDRIPFTCPYLPGRRSPIHSAVVYGIALSAFAYAGSLVEMAALKTVSGTVALLLTLLAAIAFLRLHRRRTSARGAPLKFDDVPEPEFQGLLLNPE